MVQKLSFNWVKNQSVELMANLERNHLDIVRRLPFKHHPIWSCAGGFKPQDRGLRSFFPSHLTQPGHLSGWVSVLGGQILT